jgi:signal transduction histidine kinase
MADGGTLKISTSMEEKWAVVEIADNGCGIAPEITTKIFEPYFTTKHGGTGLGLAMSAKIIDDHKGQIQISSDQSRGTTVSVKLPIS